MWLRTKDALLVAEQVMGQLDFLIAKARYSRSIKGTKPIFKEECTVFT